MSFTNQRRFPRAKVNLKVEWGRIPSGGYTGQVTSLSIGGCFLKAQSQEQISQRSVVFLRLLVAPEAVSILEGLMMGRVVYQLEDLGFGVEFMTLTDGYEKHIEDLVNFHLENAKNDP
jgi:hypothetical protein